jgi:hypothetical protein
MSYVQWDRNHSDLTLKSLMERRFTKVFGESTPWDDVFDIQDMTGRQSKYAHITDRTFLRPRDMIKFCNEILAVHEPGGEKFTNADLIAARSGYSTYLRQELVDEIHKHVEQYQDYLQVLINIRDLRFSKTDFEREWRARPTLQHTEPITGLRDVRVLRDRILEVRWRGRRIQIHLPVSRPERTFR